MNEHLRERILRKLETLNDERGYQVLDYVEFLESKYGERAAQNANVFTRFTEAVEDQLRAGRISASTIAETVGFMNRAANVLNNAVSASKSAANEFVSGMKPTSPPSGSPPPAGTTPASPAPETSAPPPGSPGEKL